MTTRIIFKPLAVLALMAGLAVSTAAQADSWETCQSNSAADAISGCTAVIQNEPLKTDKVAEAFLLRGKARITSSQNPDAALADFKRAIELEPQNADAYLERGRAYEKLGKFDLAKADYDQAVKLFSNSDIGEVTPRTEATLTDTGADGTPESNAAREPVAAVPPPVAAPRAPAAAPKRAIERKKVRQKPRAVKRKTAKSKPRKVYKKNKKSKSHKKVRHVKKKKPKHKSKPKENTWAKVNKQISCSVAGGFDC